MAGAPGPQGNTGGQGIKGAPEHVVSSVLAFATTATYPVGAYALYLGATTVYSSATYNNGDVIHKTAANVVVYAGNIIGPQGQVGPQGFSVGSFPSTAGTVETYQPVFTVNPAWENAGSSPCMLVEKDVQCAQTAVYCVVEQWQLIGFITRNILGGGLNWLPPIFLCLRII